VSGGGARVEDPGSAGRRRCLDPQYVVRGVDRTRRGLHGGLGCVAGGTVNNRQRAA